MDNLINKKEYEFEGKIDQKVEQLSATLRKNTVLLEEMQVLDRKINETDRDGYTDFETVQTKEQKQIVMDLAAKLSEVVDERDEFFENAGNVKNVLALKVPNKKEQSVTSPRQRKLTIIQGKDGAADKVLGLSR